SGDGREGECVEHCKPHQLRFRASANDARNWACFLCSMARAVFGVVDFFRNRSFSQAFIVIGASLMTKRLLFLLTLVLTSTRVVAAEQCDCAIYPFKPDPPCAQTCSAKLLAGANYSTL